MELDDIASQLLLSGTTVEQVSEALRRAKQKIALETVSVIGGKSQVADIRQQMLVPGCEDLRGAYRRARLAADGDDQDDLLRALVLLFRAVRCVFPDALA